MKTDVTCPCCGKMSVQIYIDVREDIQIERRVCFDCGAHWKLEGPKDNPHAVLLRKQWEERHETVTV